jgi:hypothetical protein
MATQFEKFKLWIFPSLASFVGLLILNIASEIRTDMKFLMTQTLTDHARIDNLERVVYGKETADLSTSRSGPQETIPPAKDEIVAIIPDNRNLKHLIKKKS